MEDCALRVCTDEYILENEELTESLAELKDVLKRNNYKLCTNGKKSVHVVETRDDSFVVSYAMNWFADSETEALELYEKLSEMNFRPEQALELWNG